MVALNAEENTRDNGLLGLGLPLVWLPPRGSLVRGQCLVAVTDFLSLSLFAANHSGSVGQKQRKTGVNLLRRGGHTPLRNLHTAH